MSSPWVQETKWDTLEVPRQLLINQIKRANVINQLLQQDDIDALQSHVLLHASAKSLNISHGSLQNDTNNIYKAVQIHNWYLIAFAIFAALTVIMCCFCLTQRYKQAPNMLQPYIATMPVPVAQTVL
jgi:hypothetical protein